MRRALIAGGVLVLALGACGSNGAAHVSTAALVVRAPARALEEKTVRISGSADVVTDGRHVSVPISGAMDFSTGTMSLSMDMSTMGLGAGSINARLVDHVMYMNFGKVAGGRIADALGGKSWIKLDLSQANAGAGAGSNATSLLASLGGAGSVRKLGRVPVRGVETEHIHAEIDSRAALRKLPPGTLRDTAEQGIAQLPSHYPVDVWIDDHGLVRRYALRVSTAKLAVNETLDFEDYGLPVHVSPPPAGDVADFSELLRLIKTGPANGA